jgi:hypothetical protein
MYKQENIMEYEHIQKFAFIMIMCRSQWSRGLGHELSSLARTLGSWVRILLKAWMSVCVYSVIVFYVQVAALRQADTPSEESYRMCITKFRGFSQKANYTDWVTAACQS